MNSASVRRILKGGLNEQRVLNALLKRVNVKIEKDIYDRYYYKDNNGKMIFIDINELKDFINKCFNLGIFDYANDSIGFWKLCQMELKAITELHIKKGFEAYLKGARYAEDINKQLYNQ